MGFSRQLINKLSDFRTSLMSRDKQIVVYKIFDKIPDKVKIS